MYLAPDPMFPEQGAKAPHLYTIDSIISPNGIDFSGNQFGGINGYSYRRHPYDQCQDDYV